MKSILKFIFAIVLRIFFIVVWTIIACGADRFFASNRGYVVDIFYLVVFIGVLIFAFTYKRWSKNTRKSIVFYIIVYCCINSLLVFSNFGIQCIKKAPKYLKVTRCWRNCRIIQEAVENYNMNNKDKMEKVNIHLLMEGNYLKELPKGSEKQCYYTSHGDLSKDGYIYCIYHLLPGNDQENPSAQESQEAEDFPNFDNYRKLSLELKDEIEQAKIEWNNNKPFSEKFDESFGKYKPIVGLLLLPTLIAFFPFSLYPFRK